MAATFVVTLREAFEAALLLGIVYTFLERIGARAQWRYVTIGAGLGLLGSVLMGVALTYASGPLLDVGPDVIAAVVIFAAVALLTWHSWWMRRHASALRGEIVRRLEEARAARRLWMVALIAFTGVFREGAETVLFLWGLLAQASIGSWSGITGGVLGVAVAAALGWAIFRGGRQVNVRTFFAVTTVILMLVAAGLFSTGLGRLQALGVLPPSDAVWDTSAVLDDHGTVGGFLGALIGYRARPSAVEVAGWLLYVLVAGTLVRRAGAPGDGDRPRTSAPSDSVERMLSRS
ncbi:MAG TPA: FTR1 family protein [Methylomirabilota bacterium]|nr:FTR1 family protein [Methylomirabilota bacterium]